MKPEKSDKANLENKIVVFREIGLVITLAILLVAFGWKSREKEGLEFTFTSEENIPEEMVEITQQKKPPPPPKLLKQTTLIEIVENEIEVEEDIIIDVEADQETEIEVYIAEPILDFEEEDIAEEEQVFVIVESMPSFPGGEVARIKYLNKNIKYPNLSRESGIQGRVFLTFVVEKDGSISNVKILRGIGGGCDEEAIRVIQNMPKWIPGKQRNIPVRVQFNMPIRFVLQ